MTDVLNREPPVVSPDGEFRHAAGEENLWNESWYFDTADLAAEFGLFLRFGLYPNRAQTWLQLAVAGRDRPLCLLVDQSAPLIDAHELRLTTDRCEVRLDCESALDRWRVTARAELDQFEKASGAYRGHRAASTDVEFDLVWETRAAPYHYGVSTRYEVSCHVAGWIRIGDEKHVIDAPGQRDHSWGVRDWWAFDWCWSAGALTDGSAFHVADIRFPAGPVGFGYLLSPAGVLTPISHIVARESLGFEDVPTEAFLDIDRGEETLKVDPIAIVPLTFESDDGRSSRLPRALCLYISGDGRRGIGWTEWNQVQRRTP